MEIKIVVIVVCALFASLSVPILAAGLARFGLFPGFRLTAFGRVLEFRPTPKTPVSGSGGSVFAWDGHPVTFAPALIPATLVVVTLLINPPLVITETDHIIHHHAIAGSD
jgi:hypothetical protein